jgi:hypothetical protein
MVQRLFSACIAALERRFRLLLHRILRIAAWPQRMNTLC